jgi:2-polyprenyl-3-methyl-5-hydroxy-6-metoxy-1,4-benzoquinol methylase
MPAGSCLVCHGPFVPAYILGLVRCSGCGFVSADMNLSDEEIRELYGWKYFHGAEYANYLQEKDSLLLNFQRKLNTLLKYVDDPEHKALFEVGCAYGFFLELARRTFSRASGIDISTEAVTHARDVLGVNAGPGDFLSAPLEDRYDVVCMWDVIEHLSRPDLFLERIASLLVPGGILALTTGDIDSMNARIRGARWRLIHPPTHLHYFSQRTLQTLLARFGLQVVSLIYAGNYRTLRSILYALLVQRHKGKRLYRLLDWLGILDRSVYTNLFDIMLVIARKE